MTARTAARIAWLLWLSTAVLIGLAVFLGERAGVDPLEMLPFVPMTMAFATAGAVVASRLPHNPIGWLFCACGVMVALLILEDQYATYAIVGHPGSLPGGEWAAWGFTWTVELAWAPIIFSMLLFPHGRLLSPAWQPKASEPWSA